MRKALVTTTCALTAFGAALSIPDIPASAAAQPATSQAAPQFDYCNQTGTVKNLHEHSGTSWGMPTTYGSFSLVNSSGTFNYNINMRADGELTVVHYGTLANGATAHVADCVATTGGHLAKDIYMGG